MMVFKYRRNLSKLALVRPPLWRQLISEHPLIASFMLACTLGGAVLGFFVLSDDLSVIRRLVGGAVGGGGVGFMLTATRMMGAWD